MALEGYPVGWFAPIYKLLAEAWRSINDRMQPYVKVRNVQERRLEFVTGGSLDMWTLENQYAGRGRKYARIIIDEASLVPDLFDIWNSAIRPTLTDFQGDAFMFSTPRGRNGFWKLYQQALGTDDWQAWTFPTSTNPFIDAKEIDAMRHSMPERFFQQEVLARFLEDAGSVFRNVVDAATATPQNQALEDHRYVMGVDWGRQSDYTAIAIIDLELAALVHLDRFTQVDYNIQMGRLTNLVNKFRPENIVAEKNAMGDPLVERMQTLGWPVTPFTTTHKSKLEIVRGLETAFDYGDISIIPDDVLIGELQAYEETRTKADNYTYSAPAGMHDDTVMALAMAWSGIYDTQSIFAW